MSLPESIEISAPQSVNYPIPSVEDDISQWPIYKLYQERDSFTADVKDLTFRRLLHSSKKIGLHERIATVLYSERERILENPWRVDPPDEVDFWTDIKKNLLKSSAKEDASDEEEINHSLLKKITHRYVEEITGNFKINTYKLARKILPVLFNTILNAVRFRKSKIQDKLKITGSVADLRSLVKEGTVILVPTHFSNLDSVLIGWAADRIGMSAFSYGAGLNLYENKIMSYFFSKLGAYTLDRRKKNEIYLEALKSFSQLSIEKGVHTLFFPGGTRSRSGHLESRIKQGLLGTVIDAQGNNFISGRNTKIFIVPVVLNYHFVLEAKSLINQHLRITGKELYLSEGKKFGFFQLFSFFREFLRNSSEIIVHFGKPMDVMGHFVNEKGESFDQSGRKIQLSDYFFSKGSISYDRQRNEEYTKRLALKIVDRYHKENVVLSSHLVTYAAFKLFQRSNPNRDLFELLRLPKEERVLDYQSLENAVEKIRKQILHLAKENKLQVSEVLLRSNVSEIIKNGVENVGAFHVKKPILMVENRTFVSQDLSLLFYYHNRLDGYDLHKHI